MLCVDLAGVPVALHCDSAAMEQWLSERFAGFASGGPPTWRLTVESTGPVPDTLGSPLEVRTEPMAVHRDGDELAIAAETFSARLDLDRRHAAVKGPLATYPFNGVLSVVLPLLCDDILVLHGALLVDGERGFVCSGRSGSGKSTLTRLVPDHARSDDLVAVRRTQNGFVVHALPFWQARQAVAVLEHVFLVDHGEGHRRTRLAMGGAFRRLCGQLLWPTTAEAASGVLERLAELVERVPVSELRFALDPGVWSVIAAGG